MFDMWGRLERAYHRMPAGLRQALARLYGRVPLGPRERLKNLCWWAAPDRFPAREAARVFETELPEWIRAYRVEPGFYRLRAKCIGPEGYYRVLSVIGLMLAASIAVFVLTDSRLAALGVLILTTPAWPLLGDVPFSKVELIVDRQGHIIERTLKGEMLLLAKFDQPYNWRAMPHTEAAVAGQSSILISSLWQGFQRIVAATAAVSRRPTGTLLAAAGGAGNGITPYQMASELFIIRGAGGAVMVKVAEFTDDAQLFKARALQSAVELAILQVRQDLADMGLGRAIPSQRAEDRYE